MRPVRSFANPPPQRTQHPAEVMQTKQPATFAGIPHAASIEHHGVELVGALYGDPEAEAAEPARPNVLRDRRWGQPGHRLACWRSRPGQALIRADIEQVGSSPLPVWEGGVDQVRELPCYVHRKPNRQVRVRLDPSNSPGISSPGI